MLKLDAAEKKIIDVIEANRERILAFARDIYSHGELGYKEFRTAEKFNAFMKQLQLPVQEGLAITGAKAYLNPEKQANVSLALIGELDALRIPDHPYANNETQAAHACGHHAQLAGVVGAAIALTDSQVRDSLDGQVVFFSTPAEEYGEIEFKNNLRAAGRIKYGGGKCELIRQGAFDDIDLSIAHHSGPEDILLGGITGNGFVSKVIRYRGRAAHAAACPENGINALNAASLGLAALSYQRETFRDEDAVRVHPIMTKGGDLVNVVPDEAVLETLVRGKHKNAILDASTKTDRAFQAGAYALGAACEITTLPGYLPTLASPVYPELARAAAAIGSYQVTEADFEQHSGGSTDIGDVQHLQPVIRFQTGGVSGGLHTVDFRMEDEELAYIATAKIFALTAYALLKNGAAGARRIRDAYKPLFTKEQYLGYMDSFD
ncbi:MAG: amidohydrolase [Sporomusaceae bacterium]|nr:amidohydrolase [Sporomusaceae bacterium]